MAVRFTASSMSSELWHRQRSYERLQRTGELRTSGGKLVEELEADDALLLEEDGFLTLPLATLSC